ncbi:hypothetical protein [Tenacibaculum caenipelagi]|uniref:hypothetical protein n=1 Tax=Tenacibaculum caenipelagi TaxID=1325435 RepID=UPI00105DFEE4|nr:hypothetical protein [Tenacibaculum caenipelagi]
MPTTRGLVKEREIEQTFIYNMYFSQNKDFVYKAKIKAFSNNVGGILIIKKIKENNFRIVFTSEFGNKFFDFELNNNQFTTHFILEAFNRKTFVKILQSDFLTLIKEKNKVLAVYKETGKKVYKTRLNNKFNYFFVEGNKNTLEKIVHTNKSRELTIFEFKRDGKEIQILHKKFPLQIALRAFD